MATQNKTKTEKVWVVKDGDGVEVYRAEAKKDLLAEFYDAVRDYFEGGTVWEDERFLLVLPDGEIYAIPDFKNITHAKKLAQKAVAIFYNGSSDLAAWINPKRVTPEAEKAIGKFELIEREFIVEVRDAQIKFYEDEDDPDRLFVEVYYYGLWGETRVPKAGWLEWLKENGNYAPNPETGFLGDTWGAQLRIYTNFKDYPAVFEVYVGGDLILDGNANEEDVELLLENGAEVEEITKLPELFTKEDKAAYYEAVRLLDGEVYEEPLETEEAQDEEEPKSEMGFGVEPKPAEEIIKVEKIDFSNVPEFEVIVVKDKEEARLNGIPVHFVGLRYYTVESFIEEARKYGVSRALPARILKQFNWGERIWLAIHTKRETPDGGKIPVATIFGYFSIQGLNLKASPRLKAALLSDPRLNVVNHIEFSTPQGVERGCGSYAVTSSTTVNAPLPLVIELIEEYARKFGEKVKVMAGGRFHAVEPTKLIGVPFTQNITYVIPPKEAAERLRKEVPVPVVKKAKIQHVKNYKLRKNYTKPDEIKEYLERKFGGGE